MSNDSAPTPAPTGWTTTDKLCHAFIGTATRMRAVAGLRNVDGKLVPGGLTTFLYEERMYAYKLNEVLAMLFDHIKTGTMEVQGVKATWETKEMPWTEWENVFMDIGFSVHYDQLQEGKDFAINLYPSTPGGGVRRPDRDLEPTEVADVAVLTGKAKNTAEWFAAYKEALEAGKALANPIAELERQVALDEAKTTPIKMEPSLPSPPTRPLRPQTAKQRRKEKRTRFATEVVDLTE